MPKFSILKSPKCPVEQTSLSNRGIIQLRHPHPPTELPEKINFSPTKTIKTTQVIIVRIQNFTI